MPRSFLLGILAKHDRHLPIPVMRGSQLQCWRPASHRSRCAASIGFLYITSLPVAEKIPPAAIEIEEVRVRYRRQNVLDDDI
jgi:hypothetical protein